MPVVNEYGASETKLLAFEIEQGEMILGEELSFIEVLKMNEVSGNNSGGNIIVTDFFNKAMPFIRYNIGDMGVISDQLSADGKHRKLEKLLGRENDTIILPSGKQSPGLTFYYISRSILESSGILKEFIIRQTSLDSFIFEIVSDRELHDGEVKVIQEKMDLYLELGLKLEIRRVPKIDRPSSGKIKHFFSELS